MDDWSIQEWQEWLQAVIRGETTVKSLNRDSEPHLDIIALYNDLPSLASRQRFAEAVGQLLAALPVLPRNAAHLYTLLHVFAYTRPQVTIDRLRHHLFIGSFQNILHEGASLHTLLLEVVGAYDLTAETVSYIARSVRQPVDPSYATAAMRVMELRDRKASLELLPHVLQGISRREDVAPLATHLKGFAASYGYEGLYYWWAATAERMYARSSHAVEWLTSAMIARGAIDDPVTWNEADSFRAVFSAAVAGDRRHLTPTEVLNLTTAAADVGSAFESIFEVFLRQQFNKGSRIGVWSDATYGQDERYFLVTGAGKLLVGDEWAAEIDFISEMTGSRKPDWYPDQSSNSELEKALAALAERVQTAT